MSLALTDPGIAGLLILPAFASTGPTLADYAVSLRILVDTGSQINLIAPSLVKSLHLTPICLSVPLLL